MEKSKNQRVGNIEKVCICVCVCEECRKLSRIGANGRLKVEEKHKRKKHWYDEKGKVPQQPASF